MLGSRVIYNNSKRKKKILANSLRTQGALRAVAQRSFAVGGFKPRGNASPRILNRLFNMVDKSTTAYRATTFDPSAPFEGRTPVYRNELAATYKFDELSNGFSVLTESQTFPGQINMGK